MKFRYFETLETELLLEPYTLFSPQQLKKIDLRLQIEANSERQHFTRYLQAVIAVTLNDYALAERLFQKIDSTKLSERSRYFMAIYHTLTDFHFGRPLAPRLEIQRSQLPGEYYAHLLTKLVIATHQLRQHQAHSFYLSLQLFRLFPTLPKNSFVATSYYEIGIFYSLSLQNTTVAHTCFKQAQVILAHQSNPALAVLLDIAHAYNATVLGDDTRTNDAFLLFLGNQQASTHIDELLYYKALINAVYFFLRTRQHQYAQQLRPTLDDIALISDSQKRDSLIFSAYCLRIHWLLTQSPLEKAELVVTIQTAESLLTKLHDNFLLGNPQLAWLQLRGKTAILLNDLLSARNYFQQALKMAQTNQLISTQIEIYQQLSQIYASTADFEQAIDYFETADQLREQRYEQQNQHYLSTLKQHNHSQSLEVSIVDELRHYQQLNYQTTTDLLTKLGNRQALAKLERAYAHQYDCAVAMIDLDHFKAYNDYYGHLGGDAILTIFAKLLREHFVNYDVIRYGGEEFSVIATEVNVQDFAKQLKQFLAKLATLAIPHHGISDSATLTTSIGYSYRVQPTPLAELIQIADTALYRAKTAGRNQIQAEH